MRTSLIGAFVAVTVVAFSACTSGGGSGGGTGGTIDGTSWLLTSYDVSGTATTVPAEAKVSAAFAGGRVAGTSGCNQYSAGYTVTGANLTVGQALSTQMACAAPLMTLEQAYLANLAKAATFTATSSNLTIFGSDGKQLLAYALAPVVPITTGTFHATAVNNGTGGVQSVPTGSDLTATFAPDGTVSGSSGCNTYNGTYMITGDSMKIGPLATSRKACPDDVMKLETQYLTALQSAATFELSATDLQIRDASGATQVQYLRGT